MPLICEKMTGNQFSRIKCDIFNVWTQPLSPNDPMGQVVHGKLKMGGEMGAILLIGYPEDPNTPPYVRESYQIDTLRLGR